MISHFWSISRWRLENVWNPILGVLWPLWPHHVRPYLWAKIVQKHCGCKVVNIVLCDSRLQKELSIKYPPALFGRVWVQLKHWGCIFDLCLCWRNCCVSITPQSSDHNDQTSQHPSHPCVAIAYYLMLSLCAQVKSQEQPLPTPSLAIQHKPTVPWSFYRAYSVPRLCCVIIV